MNCKGCGADFDPTTEEVDQTVDLVLDQSLKDAKQSGGVCPLCGHSQLIPVSHRKTVLFALLIACLVLLGVGIGVVFYERASSRSSVTGQALNAARNNVAVRQALGGPIRVGQVKGTVHQDETGWGEAKLTIPISGPKANGTLFVTAARGTGAWVFSDLEVEFNNSTQRINLLAGPATAPAPNSFPSIHMQPAVMPDFGDIAEPHVASGPGTYPCITLNAATHGGSPSAHPQLSNCDISMSADSESDRFEVDLRSGTFVMRNTDLYRADVMPLSFTRTYRSGLASQTTALGYGINHPYDVRPVGSRNPYTFIDILMPDGNSIHFDRISKGTGYADAVYEHTATDTRFFQSRFWWTGHGWELKFKDGSYYRFPESYNAKTAAQGGLVEMHDGKGNEIQFLRDGERNLTGLISQHGKWIHFRHDSQGRIIEARDDQGRLALYKYDDDRRLEVVKVDGSITEFSYDGPNVVSVEFNGKRLVQNKYVAGRISQQIFANGTAYTYSYKLANGKIVQATVSASDRSGITVAF